MPNIKFNYLYRDSGDYKKYTLVIFANAPNIALTALEILIKSKLIWGEWFYAEKWKLPEIFTNIVDFRVDPTWHEFESVEYTEEPADVLRCIEEFVVIIEKTNRKH